MGRRADTQDRSVRLYKHRSRRLASFVLGRVRFSDLISPDTQQCLIVLAALLLAYVARHGVPPPAENRTKDMPASVTTVTGFLDAVIDARGHHRLVQGGFRHPRGTTLNSTRRHQAPWVVSGPECGGGDQISVAVSCYEKCRRERAPSFTGKIAVESRVESMRLLCEPRRMEEGGDDSQPTTVGGFLALPHVRNKVRPRLSA
jgi:hypothetical protein